MLEKWMEAFSVGTLSEIISQIIQDEACCALIEIAVAIICTLIFLWIFIRITERQKTRKMAKKLFPQLDPDDPRMVEIMNHASKCLFLNLLTSKAIQEIYAAVEKEKKKSKYSWQEDD